MFHHLRHLSYTACTLIAFLTLGSAPRAPAAQPRDLLYERDAPGAGRPSPARRMEQGSLVPVA